jgi:hypothetical protein
MMVISFGDDGTMEGSFAIHQMELVAHAKSQHTQGVLCFVLWQLPSLGRGCIKEA